MKQISLHCTLPPPAFYKNSWTQHGWQGSTPRHLFVPPTLLTRIAQPAGHMGSKEALLGTYCSSVHGSKTTNVTVIMGVYLVLHTDMYLLMVKPYNFYL